MAESQELTKQLDGIYRAESRRILATLVRLLGDLDIAEEALHEGFRAALETWPRDGVPANPRAWLVSAGRFRAIDALRRQSRFEALDESRGHLDGVTEDPGEWDMEEIEDDRLRLIFTCCHPALPQEAQIALTLREVCGLSTEEIARAFLITPSTLAQRIVRAKAKIRDERIPYEVPGHEEMSARLEPVLRVVYLVFNEGYAATSGDSLTRKDLSEEAIRLGRVLVGLLQDPEAIGLLALMLLQESRREARESADGEIILLGEQDRSLWRRDLIDEGSALAERALSGKEWGPYTIQAAIAAVHAAAKRPASTDWERIVRLYDLLLRLEPSPVIELNRAVAVAMRDGPAAGLVLIDGLLATGTLAGYHLAHSARGELCRQLGSREEARASFSRALRMVRQGPEKRLLERRLGELA